MEKSGFLKDNIILFLANGLGAAFAYGYHFYIGRTLGPESYSTVGAILSLVFILLVLVYTIQTAVAKHVVKLKASNQAQKISYLFKRLLTDFLLFGIIGAVILLTITPLISSYLTISKSYIYLLAPLIIVIGILAVAKGFLQGLQDFKGLGWTHILEGLSRLALAIILVTLGLGLTGAVIAIILSYIIPLLYSILPLKKILKTPQEKFSTLPLYIYTIPVLIGILSMTLFFTIDVLLVKHYFTAAEAGLYTAISNLGKIIYFGSITVGLVLFPKVAEAINSKKKRWKLLLRSLILVLLIGIPPVTIYYLFPKLPISILYGTQYLVIAPLIGIFATFMLFVSLNYILLYYHLARHQYEVVLACFSLVGIQVVTIMLNHKTISAVIHNLLLIIVITFTILFTSAYLDNRKS